MTLADLLSTSFTLVWQRVVVLIFTRSDTQVRSVVSGIPSSVLDAKIEHEQKMAGQKFPIKPLTRTNINELNFISAMAKLSSVGSD